MDFIRFTVFQAIVLNFFHNGKVLKNKISVTHVKPYKEHCNVSVPVQLSSLACAPPSSQSHGLVTDNISPMCWSPLSDTDNCMEQPHTYSKPTCEIGEIHLKLIF